MQQQPYPGQEALALPIPVQCTYCGTVITDALDPELQARLLDHLCAGEARWCA